VGHHLVAQVERHALGQQDGAALGEVIHEVLHQVDAEHGRRDEVEALKAPARLDGVHGYLQRVGHRHVQAGQRDGRDQHDHQRENLRAENVDELAQRRARVHGSPHISRLW